MFFNAKKLIVKKEQLNDKIQAEYKRMDGVKVRRCANPLYKETTGGETFVVTRPVGCFL